VSPSADTVRVRLFGACPSANFDLSRFNFHVPTKAVLSASIEPARAKHTTATAKIEELRFMNLLLVETSGEMELLGKATAALPQRKAILIGYVSQASDRIESTA
jgi:hypothetical protein